MRESSYHSSRKEEDCCNYRDITLMSALEKILARVMKDKIIEKLENTLEEAQYEYKSVKST